ncbi:MAG: MFS transporter [Roseiflexaceae bacterium]
MNPISLPQKQPIYYGWIALYTISVTEVISWGILYYAFSVFVPVIAADLSWPTAALMAGFSLSMLSSGLAAVPVGRWIDRHGPRLLMTIGSITATLLVLAWSMVTELWVFYLIMIGIGIVSAMVLYEPAFALVAVWFRRRRGQALTILTFFGALASFIFLPLSNWLIDQFGWRMALLALAAILGSCTILPHALVLRRRPADLGLLPDGDSLLLQSATPAEPQASSSAALRDPGFWLLSVAFTASTIATITQTVHLIPYLLANGHSSGFAAQIAGMFGLMSLIGRLTIGPLGERFPRTWITAILMIMQLLAIGLIAVFPNAIGAWIYILLFGAGSGTMTIMRAALLAERYGASNYGSISGIQNAVTTAARTIAPIGASVIVAWIGGYSGMLWLLVAILACGVAAILFSTTTRSVEHPT